MSFGEDVVGSGGRSYHSRHRIPTAFWKAGMCTCLQGRSCACGRHTTRRRGGGDNGGGGESDGLGCPSSQTTLALCPKRRCPQHLRLQLLPPGLPAAAPKALAPPGRLSPHARCSPVHLAPLPPCRRAHIPYQLCLSGNRRLSPSPPARPIPVARCLHSVSRPAIPTPLTLRLQPAGVRS